MAEPQDYELCVYCPRLCRHVCPVAVGSAREAATPTAAMTGVWSALLGRADDAAAWASLCVGCGACTAACKHHRPVAELLGAHQNPPPGAPAPPRVEGEGELVAVEIDDRRWAEALSARAGVAVARLRTADRLGAAWRWAPDRFGPHAAALRAALSGRTPVTADGASADALRAAGVEPRPLTDWAPLPDHLPRFTGCRGPAPPEGPGCCGDPAGAAAALSGAWPEVAADLRADARARLGPGPAACADAGCARHLAGDGLHVADPIDLLLQSPAGAAP